MSEIERAIEKKDYIERGAALELFWEYSGNWNLINAIPDADVEPVARGEWEVAIGYDPNKKVQCQNCYKMAYEPTPYCPNCGAKMDVEEV